MPENIKIGLAIFQWKHAKPRQATGHNVLKWIDPT